MTNHKKNNIAMRKKQHLMTSAVINQHGYITVGVDGEGRGEGEAQDVEDLMGKNNSGTTFSF